MSSHHFVRDEQEPALLILTSVEFSLAGSLLEWAPTVMVTQEALEDVLSWGIKVDVVMADLKGEDVLKEKLLSQAPVKILTSETDVFFETALFFLLASKQKAVTILSSDVESVIGKATPFVDKITINILSPENGYKWSGISAGFYKKWLPAGSRLKLYGVEPSLLVTNLQKDGNETEVTQDGLIELRYPAPFWVGESQQNKI